MRFAPNVLDLAGIAHVPTVRAMRQFVAQVDDAGSYSLDETAAKQRMVRLVCEKCDRRGQYPIDRLLEQYGLDIAMPDQGRNRAASFS